MDVPDAKMMMSTNYESDEKRAVGDMPGWRTGKRDRLGLVFACGLWETVIRNGIINQNSHLQSNLQGRHLL